MSTTILDRNLEASIILNENCIFLPPNAKKLQLLQALRKYQYILGYVYEEPFSEDLAFVLNVREDHIKMIVFYYETNCCWYKLATINLRELLKLIKTCELPSLARTIIATANSKQSGTSQETYNFVTAINFLGFDWTK